MNDPKHPTPPSSRAARHLHLERVGNERRLTNTSRIDIKRLVYDTCAIYTDFPDEGEVTVSTRSYSEITGLVSGGAIILETIDPFEDGRPYFNVSDVEWADGLVEKGCSLSPLEGFHRWTETMKREAESKHPDAEVVPITTLLDASRKFLRSDESKTVKYP